MSMVLIVMWTALFEPIELIPIRMISIKTELLLVVTSVKRVCDLCVLSVHPDCTMIREDLSGAVLRPNPTFVPKNINSSYRSRVITFEAFLPPPHKDEEDKSLYTLCPVHALTCYIQRTRDFCKYQQLLVCYGEVKPRSGLHYRQVFDTTLCQKI